MFAIDYLIISASNFCSTYDYFWNNNHTSKEIGQKIRMDYIF